MFFKNIKSYIHNKKSELKKKGIVPKLAIVQVGDNEASNRYIKNKIKDCVEVGIDVKHYWYPEDISESDFLIEVKDLQEFYDGVIVQMPLPPQISDEAVKLCIKPEKDVDGFHPMSTFKPATAKGIMDYLKYCGWNPVGKNVVIIGRSDIVGKPLAKMMTDADATVTLCHSKSYLNTHIYHCDLIVCAVGKPDFLDCKGIYVPVVDVGINFKDGKMVGDCFNTEGKDVTPVPGGVGLLTRLALLENVFAAAETKSGIGAHKK